MKGRVPGYLLGFLVAAYFFAPDPLLQPFRSARPDPHQQACRDNMESLAKAVGTYTQEHEGQLPQNLYQLVPDSLPQCPAAAEPSYRYESGPGAGYGEGGPESFLITCSGGYHRDWGTTGRFPAYDSTHGYLESRPEQGRERP